MLLFALDSLFRVYLDLAEAAAAAEPVELVRVRFSTDMILITGAGISSSS